MAHTYNTRAHTHTHTHIYPSPPLPIHTHTHTHTHTHQIKEVYVKENDSIGEDEVILEFYPEQD